MFSWPHLFTASSFECQRRAGRRCRAMVLLSVFPMRILLGQTGALAPPSQPVPPLYFGLHIHRAVPGPRFSVTSMWPNVGFEAWRLWDTYTSWLFLEPARGQWHFDFLDRYVAIAAERHVEIMLTLGSTPQWASARPDEPADYHSGSAAEPAALDDWSEYVKQVATRYKGKIHEYEIWNEPDLRQYFSGSVDQMLVLAREAHRIIKEADSANVVISPSPEGGGSGLGWLDQYLGKGGAAYADVIGYHFYVKAQPPEALVPLIQRVREIMYHRDAAGKPLWNTETGWFIANDSTTVRPVGASAVLSAEDAPGYVARALVLGWAAGLSRFYWYAWDNTLMGLTEASGQTPKPAALAYGTVRDWLVGARIISCKEVADAVWLTELERSGGYRGWILWSSGGGTKKFEIPQSWNPTTMHDLRGVVSPLPRDGVVALTGWPILVQHEGP